MLAALAVLAGPVLAIIALVMISNTNHRLRKTMAELQALVAQREMAGAVPVAAESRAAGREHRRADRGGGPLVAARVGRAVRPTGSHGARFVRAAPAGPIVERATRGVSAH